jgi:hypothetical protein
MANKKISALTSASTPLVGTEVLPIVQSGATVQVSVANLNTYAPAVSVYLSTDQTIASGSFVKVLLDTETFDTNNNFASSRFTPTVAGYYQVSACISFSATPGYSVVRVINAIYKNGALHKILADIPQQIYTIGGSVLIYCNGSSDYLELYGYCVATLPVFASGSTSTWFSAVLVK